MPTVAAHYGQFITSDLTITNPCPPPTLNMALAAEGARIVARIIRNARS
jgi:hypothetical protein